MRLFINDFHQLQNPAFCQENKAAYLNGKLEVPLRKGEVDAL